MYIYIYIIYIYIYIIYIYILYIIYIYIYIYKWIKKTHIIYLKSQIFLFFSEALTNKASEKKRNICDFK